MNKVVKFYFYNHQNKSLAMINALQAAGWEWTAQAGHADMVFSDSDVPSRVRSLESFRRRGKKIFIVPHAARPNLFNDFEGYPSYLHVAAEFVAAAGHIEIQKRAGVRHNFEVIGWYLCPIQSFQPRPQAKKILFAPIHPNGNLSLPQVDRQINIDTFKRLLPLVEAGEIELTVRFLRGLERNGLWLVDGVTYIEAQPDQAYIQIDQADRVVSHQTFAHIAVARGVPTVMMGESVPPRIGCDERNNFQYILHFDRYKDLLMFPLDILAEDDTLALFQRAIRDDCEIADWRTRMIGEPFDPGGFVRTVEKYL